MVDNVLVRRSGEVLLVLGGLIATLGGTAFVGFWVRTLDHPEMGPLSNPGSILLALTAVGAVMLTIGAVLKHRDSKSSERDRGGGAGGAARVVGGDGQAIGGEGGAGGGPFGRGGDGGSATVVGGRGKAVGGKGGRGGSEGRHGGPGGDALIAGDIGNGVAGGGAGGEAMRLARPALGGASPLLEHGPAWVLQIPDVVDEYGIPIPGRGGDSHDAYVEWEGRSYSMNVLLRLLEMGTPVILDDVDATAHGEGAESADEWWAVAVKLYPAETASVMEHMRRCEAETGAESPPAE